MQYEEPKVYAVKHKNLDIRMSSRSGGIFTALSDMILSQGGVIYGCVLDKEFQALHIRADSTEKRNAMRCSKYIQSDLRDTFHEAKRDLDSGIKVLFSGTSCQIAGFKAFLGKDYDNLICVDIVCHGVPSNLIWSEYIKWQEKSNHGKCEEVVFRNKKDYGWNSHVETLKIGNKVINSKIYTELFYNHNILRPSCFACPYKDVMHPADITIADYWGIDKAAPGFNDNKGVSLVLINNDKGYSFFQYVVDDIDNRECRIEDSLQPPLQGNYDVPGSREKFWKDFYKYPFGIVVSRYCKNGTLFKLNRIVKRAKYKIFKS